MIFDLERNPQEPEQLHALEMKARRRLLQGKAEEAINDLRFIISELRRLEFFEKADLLEMTLNQFLTDLSIS